MGYAPTTLHLPVSSVSLWCACECDSLLLFLRISSEYTNNMSHSYSFGLEEFTTVHEE